MKMNTIKHCMGKNLESKSWPITIATCFIKSKMSQIVEANPKSPPSKSKKKAESKVKTKNKNSPLPLKKTNRLLSRRSQINRPTKTMFLRTHRTHLTKISMNYMGSDLLNLPLSFPKPSPWLHQIPSKPFSTTFSLTVNTATLQLGHPKTIRPTTTTTQQK